jgi:hypothetical protein
MCLQMQRPDRADASSDLLDGGCDAWKKNRPIGQSEIFANLMSSIRSVKGISPRHLVGFGLFVYDIALREYSAMSSSSKGLRKKKAFGMFADDVVLQSTNQKVSSVSASNVIEARALIENIVESTRGFEKARQDIPMQMTIVAITDLLDNTKLIPSAAT